MSVSIQTDSEFNFPVIPEDFNEKERAFLLELRGLLMRKLIGRDFIVPGDLVVGGNLYVRGNLSVDGEIITNG